MGVSRRGYYDWLDRPESSRATANHLLLVEITRIFNMNRGVYGAPRIHRALLDEGYPCGLNRVARLMCNAGLIPKMVRKFRITTDSRKSRHPAQNLLNRNFETTDINKKWVADVTYIPTREGWLFLAVVLDLYSRKIVGWSLGERLDSQLAQRALQYAIDDRQLSPGLLVHSDRGKEYYAGDYQFLLSKYDLIFSMSRLGNCWDNAVMESFFHSLKVEQLHHYNFRTRDDACTAIFDNVEIFYNRQRLYSSIDYLSSVVFEEHLAA